MISLSMGQNADESDVIVSEREKVELVQDSNVSEAIERRPDLQFNNITIDGEASGSSLSDLPSEAVDSLEVMRAITPDLDADARGGSLNVESKPIFLLEESVNKLEASLEYDEEGSSWGQDFSISTSRTTGNFGYRLGFSIDHYNSYNEASFSDWIYHEEQMHFAPEFLTVETEESEESEYKFNSRIDYKVSDSLYLFTRVDLGQEDREETNPSIVYRFDSGDYSNLTANSGQSANARIDRNLLDFSSEDTERFWQVGAVHDKDAFHLDAKVSIEKNRYYEPDWYIIEFEQNDVDLAYQWNDPQSIEVTTGESQASDFAFDEIVDERWHNDQDDLIATLNLKRSFETDRFKGFLKGGLKYRNREKRQNSDSHLHDQYNGAFDLSDVAIDGGTSSELDKAYDIGPVAGASESHDFFEQNYANFPLNIRRTREHSDGNSYFVSEDITSAYVMLNTEWGAFRSILGGRVEETTISYEASEVVIGENGEYIESLPRAGDRSYSNFFPSAHLRYFLNDRTTLIGSWTQSIKRPNYGSVVPFRSINYGNRSIEEGSPELKPTLFDNLDLSLDYELTENSTVSLELFRRDISDLVFWENTRIDSGEFAGFDLGRNRNGPSADRQGLNLIWNQSLQDWSQKLEGISFNLKASLIDSESEYPNRPHDTLPAVYDSDFSLQISATYDREKVFAQLTYSDRDDYLKSVDDLIWRDRYDRGREQLELSASYQINKNTRIFFEAENLLVSHNQDYLGDTSRPMFFGVSRKEYTLGARMNF
ncbi:TonB-dependent receptor domain protein [Verrucomicrobiia bacterium DG1235]|nr:TonB-dependent receptor domain protein [Verrucomicrobiae bacterium DG1235]